MGRWGDREVGRWGRNDGEIGRQRDGGKRKRKMRRWGDREKKKGEV
jgi:hypothetical protein